ncbi:uncharacterized protein PFL1_04918 [Pseudozyma flocculosa PF-1]|uniref:Related to TNA1 - high affinity nicotinic acid plasma membrane permease n=2 Tax=Pseudozyma flocculosa TaxID=84751 RepID=A0A5C3EVC3_9BASI|nr:uncharacterized protein PFL1_04918 [Pseudozyma flocculosa PF-1]EPQ27379.1 hypothetical protein PFL1_04918 [Pseudozyma flocculosa PF-1]SPO36204.1 related to TNA1 - high affinity nicotinic acid plasma membrane permease [Pseudozyma flocculosa]
MADRPAHHIDSRSSDEKEDKVAVGTTDAPFHSEPELGYTRQEAADAHELTGGFSDINSGFDEQEIKRVRTRIDRRLLPILGALYSIALIDRTNLSAARIAGAEKDLKLNVGQNYTIATLIFFVPYIIFEMPSNLLLRKIGPAKQLSAIATLWGIVMMAQGFVKDWKQLVVTRFFTGLLEAGFFPACVLLVSCFYVRRESQVRMSAFYLVSVGFSGFSNIIAYGISKMNGLGGLAGWRWIFIMEGLATIVLGVSAYWLIIDFPDRAVETGFLKPEERDLILTRIQRDRGDAEADPLTMAKLRKYALDIKPWIYGIMFMNTTLPTYAYAFFLPVILRGMGYSIRDTFLLGAAPYCVAMVMAFGFALISDRFFTRIPVIVTQCLLTIVGLAMLFDTTNKNVMLAGAFLGVSGANGNIPAILNFSQNNIVGQSKRSFVSVVVVSFGGIGGIFASCVYQSKDAPLYRPGLYATMACQAFNVVACLCFAIYFSWANKKVREGKKVVEGKPGFTYTI